MPVVNEPERCACIWRDLAPDSDTIVREGLAYLKAVEHKYFPIETRPA